jgi:hypothetical protein
MSKFQARIMKLQLQNLPDQDIFTEIEDSKRNPKKQAPFTTTNSVTIKDAEKANPKESPPSLRLTKNP